MGKFDIQKCLFTESECTFPWNKSSGKERKKKRKAVGNIEQIILSFQPGYIRKNELQSEGLWCFFVIFWGKISAFFWNSSVLSVQHFPYGALWECSVLAWTLSSYFTELAVSRYVLEMSCEVSSLFVSSRWCFFLGEPKEGLCPIFPLLCSSTALTAVSSGANIHSNPLVLKKTGQERAVECNRLKQCAISSAAACRLEIKNLLE